MNDYKELISALREEAEAVQAIEWEIPICTSNHIAEAADAIEQLVKERDEWKTLGSLANKRAEDYREMRRQRDKTIKERDAAVADIPRACGYCKWYVESDDECVRMFPCNNISGVNTGWEWRGEREDEVSE